MLRKTIQIVVTCFTLIFVLSAGNVYGADSTANLKNDVINSANAYKSAVSELNAVKKQYPAFDIQGNINDVGNDSYIIIYGTALSSTASNTAGWQAEEGNIMILNPKKNKINYISNMFYDTGLFYVKTEYYKNKLGGVVPVKVYTYAKAKALTDSEKLVDAASKTLQAKADAYKNSIISKHKSLLNSADVAVLKSNGDDILHSSKFLIQYANDEGLNDLAISFFKKINTIEPNNMDALITLANIYKDINNTAELYNTNLAIAKLSTDVFIERMDINKDILTIISILKETGHPELAVTQYEAYFSKHKNTNNKEIHEGYINTLYEIGTAQKNTDNQLKYLLKTLDAIEAYRLVVSPDIDTDMKNLQKNIRNNVYTIYFNKGDLDSAKKYNQLLDNFGTSKSDDAIDSHTLQLADSYAKAGNLKEAYNSFLTIIKKHRKGLAYEDVKLESDNANSNLVLAYAYSYLCDSSNETEETLNNCLKYLFKAYKINPNDAKINNAIGYVYECYYKNFSDSFTSMEKTPLSKEDLADKIINFYLKATKTDPTYKVAFGNLYNYCSKKYDGVDKNQAMQRAGIDDTFLDGFYKKSLNENGTTQMGFLSYN